MSGEGIPGKLMEALAARYELDRTVGRGGMATVYRARDVKHARVVAVKVLRPDLAAALGTERFLNEIQIAARLHHPHIVPLFDSGEAGGFLYYAMPLIDGESLRGLMNRERHLGLAPVLSIAREVADALSYAHRMGVLHRDIKPENVLLSDGHAFVTDFGIAKAVTSAGGANLTRSGFPIGTVGYMSPEQAAGVRQLDARTDVYGLACVVYEMLVGETPGLWLTTEAVSVGRFVDAEPDHRARLDALPGRLEQVLARALALRPTDRFPTPTGFADALVSASERSRRVSDEEMRTILAKATELDASAVTEPGALSIGGVEQIAAQVGIPAERVREAIAELSPTVPAEVEPVPPPVPALPQVGVPAPIRYERTIDGEIPEDRFDALLREIRTTIGLPGQVVVARGALTWTAVTAGPYGGRVQVHVAPAYGHTEVRVEEVIQSVPGRIVGGAIGLVGGGLLGIAFGLGLGVPELFGMFGAAGGAYLLARSVLMNTIMLRERKLEALADRLVLIGAAEVASASR
ncbi:MAG: serine/threonine protein kinase [Gemmatimonadota bacterium]|nr:serine/threonine protein kinase [Gemmatimonadota bacterium]